MNPRDIKTRQATDADGPAIARLSERVGWWGLRDLDWSHVAPYWVVSEAEERLVGAFQFFLSLPVAHVDHMLVDPKLRIKTRAMVVISLNQAALALARQSGASGVTSHIGYHQKGFRKVAGNRGWEHSMDGEVVFRSLR